MVIKKRIMRAANISHGKWEVGVKTAWVGVVWCE